MVKVSVSKKKCIGCKACVEVCDNFKMVGDKSEPIDKNPKEVGCNEKAAKECPTSAITVK
ncbi:ferredoxin [Candidatus Woesearchaeota archaeon]|jgi:ferredoxin|nr:ferredoxin [Candidatus Woesearchaeota archaeon]MBT7237552.1 ferredoxin [Candidatus Woesearchaeota archaeon]